MSVKHLMNIHWTRGCYFSEVAAAAAESLQSCPTPCDPIDTSPPGSPVPGILQARALERVAISFSNAWKWKVKGKSLSCVWLFTTPWTAAYQAPPSMGFSRQEYWSGMPLPSPGVERSLKEIMAMRTKVVLFLLVYNFHCQWSCFSKIKFSKNLLDMEKQLAMGILSWEEQSRLRVSKLSVSIHMK